MIVATSVVLLVGLVWLALLSLPAAVQVLSHPGSDRPGTLVAAAARHLAAERPEGAQAKMLAEIGRVGFDLDQADTSP